MGDIFELARAVTLESVEAQFSACVPISSHLHVSYQTSILLVKQLVSSCQRVPVLLFDELFYFLIGQVDAIIEVSAPKDVVM